jgi:TRAP-type C4-dicarboxylate transport system permease small subunit
MSNFLSAYVRFTRAVNRAFVFVAGALAVAILAVVANDIVRRSVFDDPTMWGLDYSRFGLVYLAFFAMAPALQAGTHVNVDLVEHALPPKIRRWVRLIALILVLVFGSYLLWYLMKSTREVFVEDSLFPTVVTVKHIEVYWVAPLGILQFLLTGVAMLIEEWRNGARPERDPTVAGA